MSNRHSTAYGAFSVDPMPGQPQVALCHSFFIPVKMRGQGFAHKLKRNQIAVLREDHFDYAVCTCAGENVAQQAVLSSAGWALLSWFSNTRTGGVTQLWGKQVNEEQS